MPPLQLTVIEGGKHAEPPPRHHYRTHAYFKVTAARGTTLSVDDVAGALNLSHEPIMAPYRNALYFMDDQLSVMFSPAMLIHISPLEIVFAVLYQHEHYITLASGFAKLIPPPQ